MFAASEDPAVGPLSGSGLAHALAVGEAFAEALGALSPGELADGSLSATLCELDPLLNRLDAARVALVGAWDARSVWLGDGARSGAAWLACHTTASRPAAAGLVHLARDLRTMPLVDAAFQRGEIGVAQVRLLAAARAEAPEVFGEHEEMLVGHAKSLRADQLAKALAFWRAHANPDGAEDRDAKRFESRGVSLTQGYDGMWDLTGRLTGEAGELLRDVLDDITRRLYATDKALADVNPDLPVRTGPQRRHDALEDIARQQRIVGENGAGLNVPSITAVINAEALADERTRSTDPVGETANGDPVTKAMAERWTCDCSLSRVLMGPESVPVNLGMTARLPSPAQRRALAVRYRGCAFPGCDRPPGWTSAHHIIHWVHDGPTDLDNLVPLCTYHHHCVHEGGFGLRRRPSGALHFTRPDGTELQVPKHRAPDPTQGPHPYPDAA